MGGATPYVLARPRGMGPAKEGTTSAPASLNTRNRNLFVFKYYLFSRRLSEWAEQREIEAQSLREIDWHLRVTVGHEDLATCAAMADILCRLHFCFGFG
jgi:hypothetical protein